MDPNIENLVTNLRDADVEVRRKALSELSKVEDRKYVIAAIHWTMLNDIDDEIRTYARDIYAKIGELEKKTTATTASEKPVAPLIETPEHTREEKQAAPKHFTDAPEINRAVPVEPENRPHIKPVLARDPNVPGSWSVHFALISVGLIILATLWHIPYMQEKVLFLDIIRYVGLGCTIPGIILGIIGLRVKDKGTGSACWGIILNTTILLIGVWNIVSPLIMKKTS